MKKKKRSDYVKKIMKVLSESGNTFLYCIEFY